MRNAQIKPPIQVGKLETTHKTPSISLTSYRRGGGTYLHTTHWEFRIDRRYYYRRGLPNGDKLIGNGTLKYNRENKIWTCAICNYQRDKYTWLQDLGHVNSKHPDCSEPDMGRNKTAHDKGIKSVATSMMAPCIPHLTWGVVMGGMYYIPPRFRRQGHMRSTHALLQMWSRIPLYGNMKTRLNWRNDIQNHYGLICPYFHETFVELYKINRHPRNQNCPPYGKIPPTWPMVWNVTCAANSRA